MTLNKYLSHKSMAEGLLTPRAILFVPYGAQRRKDVDKPSRVPSGRSITVVAFGLKTKAPPSRNSPESEGRGETSARLKE